MTPGAADAKAMAAKQAAADLEELTKNATPNLADEVEEFEEKQQDFQAMYNAGGHFKEQIETAAKGYKPASAEATAGKEEVVEIPTAPEVAPEMGGYIEKVEKEVELAGPVMDDYTQQVLLKPAQQATKVTLPLTDEEIKEGLHHKVWEAIRWLATWCMRQVQKLQG